VTTPGATEWVKVDPDGLDVDRVTTVIANGRAICLARTAAGYGALDNHCPHQGGPLGDGQIADGYVICPWHAYEYDPMSGQPPPGFKDAATGYAVDERPDGIYVEVPVAEERISLMDQMVDVLCDWGLDTVFGMVGHSNLGLADALRKAEADGRLTYIGIRHEGAAAFAASGYAKVSGNPAACLTIAGPGATNLLTGLWDAKVDRVPVVALTGQVQTQVLGPGAFQEVPLSEAFSAVAEWTQTVLKPGNATELAALAMKHAIVQRDVAHLVFPDEVQELPGVEVPDARPRLGRVAAAEVAPPQAEFDRAVAMLRAAERPVIVLGAGARPFRHEIVALAEQLDAPVISTFKAKGIIPDAHPLACGVLGRSGIPVASIHMGRADCLLVLGASFSEHTGIATYVPTIQVDVDRMMLGKFHPVHVPLLGDIGRTVGMFRAALDRAERPAQRASVASQWARWRAEKAKRAAMADGRGRMHPAAVFAALSAVTPDDAVIAVDVGNNTYSFGRYFECGEGQTVVMSGYLGSIGFGFPAAMGAWAATRGDVTARKVLSVSGDGGFGQYLAELTTAVAHNMPITHVLLNNSELGKITREQVGALRPVWQTALHNPDFSEYARICGARGYRVERVEDLPGVLAEAMAVTGGPALVEVITSARDV
jgi:thiamine pyrophosphate-dependent acetolactate synthase large subunit-like protein/nitrite reductase/ring-hydroxylating ferredoxin subunit